MGQRDRTVSPRSTFGALTLLLLSSSLLSAQSKPVLEDHYGKLPLSFEENQGQTDAQVRFLSHDQGYALFLTDSEAVLALPGEKYDAGKRGVLRMRLAGTVGRAIISGMEQLPGKANYFIGSDPAKWRCKVPTYGKVSYKAVYPGVDLVYYGNQRQLEYDFVVAPRADPSRIKLRFTGAARMELDDGDLIVRTSHGRVVFDRPALYQWEGGRRVAVE